MGREIRRVPLDFDWPLDKVWGGFINPYSRLAEGCSACEGTGSSPEVRRMSAEWYGTAPFDPLAYGAKVLWPDHAAIVSFARRNVERAPEFYGTDKGAVEREVVRLWHMFKGQWCHNLIQADVDALALEGRLMDFTHRPRTEEQRAVLAASGNYWLRKPNGYTPTADEVNDWSMRGAGHDSINQWVCVKARCAREGITQTECSSCRGEGVLWSSAEAKQTYESWQETPPPEGEGWQLWETVSEGSPISPVFATERQFLAYLVKEGYSYGAAKKFCKSGWAPSALAVSGGPDAGFYRDIESARLAAPCDQDPGAP